MYLCIFKTLILGIEQSCEAENFVVVIHLSRKIYFARFHSKSKVRAL
jgi:hypothetical protein